MPKPPSREVMEGARQLAGALQSRSVPFAFMGGLAINAWTIPVPTYDIDACADLPPEQTPDLVRSLEAAGFVPPSTSWLESIGKARFREFTVGWPFQEGLLPVDIFLALDPFQKQGLERRRTVELDEGFRTDILLPEDLLVYKLIAYRPKDRAAIDRLFVVQRSLDWVYVKKWSSRYGVLERLAEVLREAGFPPPPA